MKRTLAVAALLIVSGCAHGRGAVPDVADAQRLVSLGDLEGADSALVDCSRKNPSNAQGALCRYRLAIVRLDPAHPGPANGATEAARDFLARDVSAPGRDDMVILARVAAQRELLLGRLDSTRHTLAAESQTPLRDDGAARLQGEVERLRAELARTQDELHRIKRRLSAPRP